MSCLLSWWAPLNIRAIIKLASISGSNKIYLQKVYKFKERSQWKKIFFLHLSATRMLACVKQRYSPCRWILVGVSCHELQGRIGMQLNWESSSIFGQNTVQSKLKKHHVTKVDLINQVPVELLPSFISDFGKKKYYKYIFRVIYSLFLYIWQIWLKFSI